MAAELMRPSEWGIRPRDVQCPQCGAPPDRACRLHGVPWQRYTYHLARAELADAKTRNRKPPRRVRYVPPQSRPPPAGGGAPTAPDP